MNQFVGVINAYWINKTYSILSLFWQLYANPVVLMNEKNVWLV